MSLLSNFVRPLRLGVGLFALGFAASALAASPLKLEVYNPGKAGLFPVSSVIVTGPTEAALIDAQIQRNDAQALVEKIKATGKTLTTVYISHADPDYYFGLDVIRAAFPAAKIVATPETVAAIQASKDGKLAHWGPILKDNAPRELVVPAPIEGRSFKVDGQALEIHGPEPARSFVWIPSIKAVVGGIPVSANIHLWMADTPSTAQRKDWIKTLDAIAALKPVTVIPAHYLAGADGKAPTGIASVKFTRSYLQAYEKEAARAKDSAQLVAAMKRLYPKLDDVSSLELGAKVVKGEMKWP